jgi:hypothetical protein
MFSPKLRRANPVNYDLLRPENLRQTLCSPQESIQHSAFSIQPKTSILAIVERFLMEFGEQSACERGAIVGEGGRAPNSCTAKGSMP